MRRNIILCYKRITRGWGWGVSIGGAEVEGGEKKKKKKKKGQKGVCIQIMFHRMYIENRKSLVFCFVFSQFCEFFVGGWRCEDAPSPLLITLFF